MALFYCHPLSMLLSNYTFLLLKSVENINIHFGHLGF